MVSNVFQYIIYLHPFSLVQAMNLVYSYKIGEIIYMSTQLVTLSICIASPFKKKNQTQAKSFLKTYKKWK